VADRTLLARGREAEVFALPDGTVLKLMRDAGDGARVHHEAAAMRALRDRAGLAPVVLDEVVVDGRPGLCMERVRGRDLLRSLGRQPWRVLVAGGTIGRVHAEMHEVRAPDVLPDVRVGLDERVRSAPSVAPRALEAVLRLLDACPDGDRLCHGDLHFGNLLGSWAAPTVIDWGSAARGDPAADVARTTLLLGIGEAPRDAPLAVRALGPLCRRHVVAAYLAAYGRRRSLDPEALRRWEVVLACARLTDGIAAERAPLLALLEARLGIAS
jgi:aminoglycoside phosphotransferase (APT) family kinase protein